LLYKTTKGSNEYSTVSAIKEKGRGGEKRDRRKRDGRGVEKR